MATTQSAHDPALERPPVPQQDNPSSASTSNPPPSSASPGVNRGLPIGLPTNDQVLAMLKNVPGFFPSVSAFIPKLA